MILLYIVVMLVCFYLLSQICERYFVRSLDIISGKLRLSHDVAGATLMAIGSSAPELFTSIIAVSRSGAEQIGAGTIVGSAIFNVLVIVGVSAAVATAYLNWQPVIRDLVFYIFSIVILFLTFVDGVITAPEAIFYIIMYVGYLVLLSGWSSLVPVQAIENHVPKKARNQSQTEEKADWFKWLLPNLTERPTKYLQVFFTSIILIGALSWVLVEMAILTAHDLGIPSVIIALTVLAAGTSVPDLISSVIVAKQGRGGMAVSNAVGSNTFDILIGLGLPWTAYILITGKEIVVSTTNLISSILLLFFTVIALLMLLAMQHFKLGRKSGLLLVVLYIGYVVWSIWQAFA